MIKIKRFFLRIRKIIKWVPIVWRTAPDWDYRYGLEVFRIKLNEIADYIEKEDLHEGTKKCVSEIRTTTKLMDMIYNKDHYTIQEYEKFVDKYGGFDFEFIKTEKPGIYTIKTVYEKEYTEDELKEVECEKDKMYERATLLDDKAHKLIWKIISNKIINWWN